VFNKVDNIQTDETDEWIDGNWDGCADKETGRQTTRLTENRLTKEEKYRPTYRQGWFQPYESMIGARLLNLKDTDLQQVGQL